MRKLFWKQYGSKFFALFIVVMMITVVYPVLINNAKNPSQLSAYDDDWNDISQFANDLDKDGDVDIVICQNRTDLGAEYNPDSLIWWNDGGFSSGDVSTLDGHPSSVAD